MPTVKILRITDEDVPSMIVLEDMKAEQLVLLPLIENFEGVDKRVKDHAIIIEVSGKQHQLGIQPPMPRSVTIDGTETSVLSPYWKAFSCNDSAPAQQLQRKKGTMTLPMHTYMVEETCLKQKKEKTMIKIIFPFLTNTTPIEKGT